MFLYVGIRRVEGWCRMWRRNDVNSQRLNDRVMWPPIQPMYWQHRLLLFFYLSCGSVCEVGFGSSEEGRGKICMVCKKIRSYIYRPGRKCCCFFCCLYFSMCKQWRLGRDSGDAQACLRLLTRSVYDINSIFLLADSIVRNWNYVVSYYTAQVIFFFLKHMVAILICCSKRLNDIGAEEYQDSCLLCKSFLAIVCLICSIGCVLLIYINYGIWCKLFYGVLSARFKLY